MTDWEKIEQLRRENAMLLEQIEYMKNAGNCSEYRRCPEEYKCQGCKLWRFEK